MKNESHNDTRHDKSALFSSLPVRDELLQALSAINYVQMSPIQAQSANAILEGRDLLAQAETGSGKTAAFAMGIVNNLDATVLQTQALVICPTRELSDQVAAEIRRLASGLANTRVLTLCGGKPLHDQLTALKHEPHIVVGTPGRLKKHLEKGTLKLRRIKTLVLDEADRMLDMGFQDDILNILEHTSTDRQTLLFSATYPDEIITISKALQKDPIEIRIPGSNTVEQIEQVCVLAGEEQKLKMLFRALGKYQPERALIFCNRKNRVANVCNAIQQKGISVRALHGDLDQRERDEATILFANNSLSVLVATDVAARGLDISALPAVISYDIAPDAETHVHRIGRTGRAGLKGRAITFVEPDEKRRVDSIEAYLDTSLRFEELDEAVRNNGRPSKPATRTILINAGKKDKIRPGDIVGAMTAGTEMTNDDIGKITVQAKISFVAVDFAKADLALKLISDRQIKRRKFRARLIS